MFADQALRADADSLYARKYTRHPRPDFVAIALEPCDEVRLTVVGTNEARPAIVAKVMHHLPPWVVVLQEGEEREHPARWQDCASYRHRFTEVTAVALDLHSSPQFDAHYRCLKNLYGRGGLRALTRPALHEYLLEHSRYYATRSESDLDGFWREFLRWGPEPSLFPPGHLLRNVMLVE